MIPNSILKVITARIIVENKSVNETPLAFFQRQIIASMWNIKVTIPDIIINSNKLIKLLNKMYSCVQENNTIDTKVFYRVGEHIKFDGKKYSLFSISITAKNINISKSKELKALAENSNFYIEVGESLLK